MPTVLTSNMNLGKAPTRANLPQAATLAAQDAAFEKPAPNPNAVFGAYASQQLGGAGTRSKFGRGTVITSGPMRGQQMGAAKEKMRQDLAKAPDSVKQAAMDRASGADLMPGYRAPAAESGRLDTYGMGGKVEYKGLDYLTAGRKSGADLAQMEKNVAATGDRNRSGPARVTMPQMRDTSAGKESKPKTAITAADGGSFYDPEDGGNAAPVSAKDAAFDYNRGGFPVAGSQNVAANPASGDPVRDAAAKWAHDFGTPRAQTAVTASAAAPVSATPTASVPLAQVQPTAPNPTPMRGMTGLGNPMDNTRGMSGLGVPMANDRGMTGLGKPMTAVSAAMTNLDKGLGQAEAAKRKYMTGAKIPEATEKDRLIDVLNVHEKRDAKLRAQNPGVKPNLIPGYGAPLEKPKPTLKDAVWNTMKATARPFM